MGRNRKVLAALAAVGVLVGLSGVPSFASAAGKPNPRVLPPQSHFRGAGYPEWGAAWWQWATKAPLATNPILDPTGAFQAIGQEGSKVFFLAGSFGEAVQREVTVTTGTALFLPVWNWVLTYPEDAPPGLSPEEAEVWMREVLDSLFTDVGSQGLECELAWVDPASGEAVPLGILPAYRAQSEPFTMSFPEDCASVTDWVGWFGTPYEQGDHYPNISDGYWVMLAPLRPGSYQLRIHAVIDQYSPVLDYRFAFEIDASYGLTVVAGH